MAFPIRGRGRGQGTQPSTTHKGRPPRLNPGRPSDWLYEREWRIPCEPDIEALVIDPAAVQAVVVGDPSWRPNDVEHEVRVPVDENGMEEFDLSLAGGDVGDSWMKPPECWVGKPLCVGRLGQDR